MQNRDLTLDLAKGLAITLVVLGHALQYSFGEAYTSSNLFFDNIVFKTIYSFHMPLFMLISGYLFYTSNQKDFRTLALSKLMAIGIPIVTFTIICNWSTFWGILVEKGVLHFFASFIDNLIRGWAMWFLSSLLMNMLIVSVITRITHSVMLRNVVLLLIFVGSMFVPDYLLPGVFKFMFPFFCIGYLVKEGNLDVYRSSQNHAAMIVLSILSVLSVCWFDRSTYIYTSGFYLFRGINDPMIQLYVNLKRMIIGLIVSYTILQCVHVFAVRKKITILERFGQMTLFVYGFNVVFDTFYTWIMTTMSWNIDFNYLTPILFTLCVIILAYYLYKLISRNKVLALLFLGKLK